MRAGNQYRSCLDEVRGEDTGRGGRLVAHEQAEIEAGFFQAAGDRRIGEAARERRGRKSPAHATGADVAASSKMGRAKRSGITTATTALRRQRRAFGQEEQSRAIFSGMARR